MTTDIVNEVLKDSNIPPIIGARAGNCEWNRMDYDGTYYFHDVSVSPGRNSFKTNPISSFQDEIIDLRDEYTREISSIQCGPLALECSWFTNQRNYRDLTKLWKSIMLAVVMGDDAAYQYTIHTSMINPFVSCILPHILQKCVEYLSFTCTEDTLDRLIGFLKAISYNEYCRDANIHDACFNLSNIFVCLLFGREDIKVKLEKMKKEKVKNKTENVKTEVSTAKTEPINGVTKVESKPTIKNELVDLDGDNDSYTKLVVNPAAMNIKSEINHFDFEHSIKYEPNFYDVEFQEERTLEPEKPKIDATEEKIDLKIVDEPNVKQEYFSAFEAEVCDDRFVDDICELIGCLGSKWGSFEYEMIYLLSKRLEIFFHEVKTWTITGNQTNFSASNPFTHQSILFQNLNGFSEWSKSSSLLERSLSEN